MIKHSHFTLAAALAVFVPLAAFANETPGGHFMLNWDLDENGSVTVAEASERRDMIFDMFDNDENGLLDAEEYVMFDEARAADMENTAGDHGPSGDAAAGGKRMQEGLTLGFNDTNADGAVSREEFLANTTAWIAQIDRDGDNAVTSADFGPRNG